jgi:hypothetical protein
MSGPAKEGARQCANFKAVCTAPSINKTPVGDKKPPLPYATFQDLSNSVAVVPNVMLNGKPAFVLEQSIQPTGQGDEPGTEKGVKSGTVCGYVKPQNASSTVTMMGMLSVRFGDPCVMNGGNNPGIYTTEEPAAANPAKSAAETSNPDMELETPEESSSAGEWLDETANDIGEWLDDTANDIGEWWEQTKYEMGEAVDNPWEGTKGAVKSIVNIVPETGEMILKGTIKKEAGNLEIAAAILDLLGESESAQGASAAAQMINNAGDSVEAPKFEMSNDAQAGGENIFTGVTGITGIVGIIKSLPKLFAKFGSKASKEADEVVEEAPSPGDGVVVKPAKVESPKKDSEDVIKKSSILENDLKQLEDDGWEIKYGEAGKGSYANKNTKVIVIDESKKGSSGEIAQALAHEKGHALYEVDPYVPPTGLTKENYVKENVKRHLKDEGEATLSNLEIRDEILSNSGPDIGVAGTKAEQYEHIYQEYKSVGDREKARELIGDIFADGERTSTNPNMNYREYYSKPYEDHYDNTIGNKKIP